MTNMNITTVKQLQTLSKEYLQLIAGILAGMRNDTVIDLTKPLLRSSVKNYYYIIVTMYVMLGACGAIFNIGFIRGLCKRTKAEWRQESTLHWIALTTTINGLLQSFFVLPATLAMLLIQNWIFGPFLCYTIPMLQDAPLHVNMISIVMLAIDRHRRVLHPTRPAIPGKLSMFFVFAISLAASLPYLAFTTYIDLGKTLKFSKFNDVAMCIVNLSADLKGYFRFLFLAMYAVPLGTVALYHVQTTRELKILEMLSTPFRRTTRSTRDDGLSNDVDVISEKRSQQFLVALSANYSLCMLPLIILRIVLLVVAETYENSGYFDIAFLVFVWIAFLPISITPIIFYLWENEISRVKAVAILEEQCEASRNNAIGTRYITLAPRSPLIRPPTPPFVHARFTTV